MVQAVKVLRALCEAGGHENLGVQASKLLRLLCPHCARRLAASNAAVAAAAVAAAAIAPDVAFGRVPAQHRLWVRRPTKRVAEQSKVLHRVRAWEWGRHHRVLQL